MKIAVMGAGAVGGYFGGLLAKSGHDVSLIARGEHLEVLKKNGLTVHSVHGDFHMNLNAVQTPHEIGKVDLVLFTPKAFDTKRATEQILPILKRDSYVINLQNGIDNEEMMAEIIGKERVIGGLTYIETTIESPGVISQKSQKRDIIFGELDGKETDRVKELQKVFLEAGIPATLSDNIIRDIWKKFMFLCSFSAITSVTGGTSGAITNFELTSNIFRGLLNEVYLVAKANKIDLTEEDVENAFLFAQQMGTDTKSSLQRDLERRRKLEVDSLSGAVVRFSDLLDLSTPYHHMAYTILKFKEKSYGM